MHSSFTVNGIRLMASDGCDDKTTLHGFQLALNVDTEAVAHKVFNALAEGGNVQMPLTKTFWSPCFGMVATSLTSCGWSWFQVTCLNSLTIQFVSDSMEQQVQR